MKMEDLQYCPGTVLLDTVKETLNPAEPGKDSQDPEKLEHKQKTRTSG